MTVTATNRKNQFSTNGVTTEFTFDFAITNVSQVYAFTVVDGIETPFTNFTAIKSDVIEGGTLTTNEVLDGVDLLIYRDTALTQQVDYESGGKFPADSHEQAIDKLTLQNQDQQEELDRTLKSSISNDDPYTVGKLEDGKILALNGSVIESTSFTEQDLGDSAANAAEAAESAAEAAASALQSVSDLKAAALAAGTTYDNITYSTNLVDEIKGYIFDADTQITYAVPEAAQGKFIQSVVDGVLTTTDTSEYDLTEYNSQISVSSLQLLLFRGKENTEYKVLKFWNSDNKNIGSGSYVWNSDTDKSLHDGVLIIDPLMIKELGSIGEFNDYFEPLNSGDGCYTFVGDAHVTNAGAYPEIDCTAGIVKYAKVMTDSFKVCDFTGGPFIYSETMDVSTSANYNARFIGNTDDLNNVGLFNLIYTGDGDAVKCQQLYHENLGLSGFGNSIFNVPPLAIRAGTIGINSSMTVTHNGSSITGFDTLRYIRGGFYHKTTGGKMSKCNNVFVYDTSVGLFNHEINTQVSEFQHGITARNGNGPLKLGGAWEKWTGNILNFDSVSEINTILDAPYIENYPNLSVQNGINTLDGNANYFSESVGNIGKSQLSGSATIYLNSIKNHVFGGVSSVVDVSPTFVVSSAAGTLPPYIYDFQGSNSFNSKAFYSTNQPFTGVSAISEQMTSSSCSGSYNKIGSVVQSAFESIFSSTVLLNGWGNRAGQDAINMKCNGSTITIKGQLDAGSATSSVFWNAFSRFKPSVTVRSVITNSDPANSLLGVFIVGTDGAMSITNLDGTDPTGLYTFSVTYSL